MKKTRMNKHRRWGLLINSFTIGAKQFISIPNPIFCFMMGVGISLLILGIYEEKHDLTKFRMWKRNLIRKY